MSDLSTPVRPVDEEAPHWTARHGKPIIFVILTLVAVGIYLAFTIPVAVFPETNFPRVVIGVDNGVFPIDQMLVTVTKPLEDAVNTVPGLDHLWSITSRGTAEIDLFFDWNVDMYRTLELVNAALSRAQASLPSTAKITANRLTFAAFPIMGYSLTSDKVTQSALWELANYELKPRLNRQPGVSTVIVQGGQVPEFQVRPDPSKLVQTAVTIPNILDAIGRSNMIDSPGMIEENHELILSLVSGLTRTPAEISNIAIKTTPAGAPVRIGDVATVGNSVMPVYTIVTANAKPAVLLNINRQPAGNTVAVANAVHAEVAQIRKELPKGVDLRPFYDQSEIVTESITSVRRIALLRRFCADLLGWPDRWPPTFAVPAIGCFARSFACGKPDLVVRSAQTTLIARDWRSDRRHGSCPKESRRPPTVDAAWPMESPTRLNSRVRRIKRSIQGSAAVAPAVVSKRNFADQATSGRNNNWSYARITTSIATIAHTIAPRSRSSWA
jgi:hypothetical protein